MPSEVRLAAASLVFAAASLAVSFVALVVALGQLLQAAFGSLEGYRRCAESVIGPWKDLRHRKPNFWEGRIEVEYATPHFMLLSSNLEEWKSASDAFGHTYDLVTFDRKGNDEDEKHDRNAVHRTDDEQREVELHRRVLRSSTSPESNICNIDTSQKRTEPAQRDAHHLRSRKPWKRQKMAPDPEKNAIKAGTKSAPRPKRTEVSVSWLPLLEAVQCTYAKYATKKGDMRNDEPGLTNAAVAIRQWNWDFMPSDLIRPLATSTLNNLILFALRLDMTWRRLDLENGVFLADGNGYSLTSTEVRGLGIAFTFTSNGTHSPIRIMAPTENVDKSIFGIIPGCKTLVKKDIHYINDQRLFWFDKVFEEIGVRDPKVRTMLSENRWVEQRYDAIILLSQFIPLAGSPLLFNYFPAFCASAAITPLHFFEGRVALMDSLKERVEKLNDQKHRAEGAIRTVLGHFEDLLHNWRADFLDNWDKSVIEGTDDTKKILLSEHCRKIFDWTTDYLSGKLRLNAVSDHPGPDWSDASRGRSRYVDLVAGHCIMAYHAVDVSLNNLDERRKIFKNTKQAISKWHREIAWRESDIAFHGQYFVGQEYAHSFMEGRYSVVAYLRSKGVDYHKDYIEAAWWVMIIRGIVWDMSTCGDPVYKGPNVNPQRWRGTNVPSSFHDLRTPVWIN